MARVYVGNLDPGTEKEELKDAFEKHGRLADVWIARNPPGFAFIVRR
jgi:arginine/serine-rich splicing factor 7